MKANKMPDEPEEDSDYVEDMSHEEFLSHHLEVNFLINPEGETDVFVNVGESLSIQDKVKLMVGFLMAIKKGVLIDHIKDAVMEWGSDNNETELALGSIGAFEDLLKDEKGSQRRGPVIRPSEVFRNLQRAT